MSEFETLTGLVSQYSPSGDEQRAVEWLVARMKSLGYDRAFIDNTGNAVGIMGQGPKQVLLLGHIDTVPGEIEVRVENSGTDLEAPILYGRGAVDAKGPLACFTDAVAQVGARQGWQFVVIGAVEEERNSEGARFVATQYQPDFAIIGEPNHWDRIALGYKGSAWADVMVRRGQVHSASGEQTACETAVGIWLSVMTFADSFNEGKPRAFDQLLPALRAMSSGQDGFEQWAQLTVGVRLPVDIPPDTWYTKLKEIVGDAQVQPGGYAIPAWNCEKNSLLVRAFLNGIRSKGGDPRFVYKTGTADLNIVAPAWKCPALVYGPGDSGLDHTPGEHISLDEFIKSVGVLAASLQALTVQQDTR